MSVIPAGLRRLVIRRAANACEYCGLPQEGQEATFHIDHVMPRVAGGETRVAMTYHYNPRRDDWQTHFRWEGVALIGLTAIGRAAIAALHMNRPLILAIRQEEAALERYPPRMT